MLQQVKPMLATLVKDTPAGEEWVFETKWDGERCVAFVTTERRKTHVRLQNRNLNDVGARYPEIVRDLTECSTVMNVVLDGEIVVLDEKGVASFEKLQHRIGLRGDARVKAAMYSHPVWYVVFDVLWLNGKDLRGKSLVERQELLKGLFASCERTRISETFGDGAALFKAARRLGVEGVMAKRRTSAYKEDKRGRDWLKVKVFWQQEVVVCGWLEGTRGLTGTLGSLITGVYEGKGKNRRLVHTGQVGTGFDLPTRDAIFRKLKRLERKTSSFEEVPSFALEPHWVRPQLVAEVKFANWTSAGTMRTPVFLGLRTDKPAKEVTRELPS